MKEMYFTIAGCNHYFGSDFMDKGMKVKLVKEPDNEYDKIADKAKGKIVFVTDGGVICKVISDGKDKPVMIEEDKVKDENQLGFKI